MSTEVSPARESASANEAVLKDGARLTLRRAIEDDVPAIAEIYNHEVRVGIGTLEEVAWDQAAALVSFRQHDDRFAIWVACLEGEVAGFCSLSRIGHRCGYRFAAETSVYTAPEYQRRGIGRIMLRHLEREAGRIGFHTLLSRITGENLRSQALFESCGHMRAGLEREVGFKFGRRIDVAIYQKLLATSRT